ncbi:hypothetical protein E1I69_06925 [Bacillus timonensis]|uniref:Uncharacterized protein n=1 Tax=Bacillus timonensis TaxID=1033734 RepID=A0A4S3PV17_9BACI|nr:hypothetical protein [Bacillus timonensis]THE13639.1 hypothetical protein E1I69_06925 [Bacillus timonensis]
MARENLELVNNMEFGITSKFIPNLCEAKTLRVVEINPSSVRIELESKQKGVFPISHFQYLIRHGALVLTKNEDEETA